MYYNRSVLWTCSHHEGGFRLGQKLWKQKTRDLSLTFTACIAHQVTVKASAMGSDARVKEMPVRANAH